MKLRAPTGDDGHPRRALPREGYDRVSTAGVIEPVLALSRQLGVGSDAGPIPAAAPVDARAAMRELLTVHRIEQGSLLLRASRLRCESTRLGRVFLALDGSEDLESDWRRESSEALDTCLLDGWEVPIELAECAARARSNWKSAGALARAACALAPSTSTRIQLARAELCEGSIESALRMLRDLRTRVAHEPLDAEWLETSALASEAGGRWDEARAAYLALDARTDASPAVHAALLALALRAGDLPQAERLRSSWMEAAPSMGGDALRRVPSLQRLRARIRFHRGRGRWQYEAATRAWIDDWQAEASGCELTADLAFALS